MKQTKNLLPITELNKLEEQAVCCWEQLHVHKSVHKASQVTAEMPVFIVNNGDPRLYICFPTYKIEIQLPENDASYAKNIEGLLQDISHRSRIRPEAFDCEIVRKRYVQLPAPLQCCSTTCLGKNLKENNAICNKVTKVLAQENIPYIVLPTYRYEIAKIKFLEDGDSFIVV